MTFGKLSIPLRLFYYFTLLIPLLLPSREVKTTSLQLPMDLSIFVARPSRQSPINALRVFFFPETDFGHELAIRKFDTYRATLTLCSPIVHALYMLHKEKRTDILQLNEVQELQAGLILISQF